MKQKYKIVIGLETHIQLKTETKMFCYCKNHYGSDANTLVCPVCLGYPGVLPVLNEKAIEKAIIVGLALNCKIDKNSKFDRKNYFYPDLPKGYQISQYDKPISFNGFIDIKIDNDKYKRINITRAHLEEDTGKSIHGEEGGKPVSYIDFNRCGTPLLEIVTDPDFENSDEVHKFLTLLRRRLRYIDASTCNMEEGSLRCDANISIMKAEDNEFGTKVEVKNMNSFKSTKHAIDYEINRQIEEIEKGNKIFQETRLWDAESSQTKTLRLKEGENDYRYFPEPDIVPLNLSEEYINNIKENLPELQESKIKRFKEDYDLPDYDIEILTETIELADYYEKTVKCYPKGAKKISNWIMSEVMAELNENKIDITKFSIKPKEIASLIELIDNNTISGKIAKIIFPMMIEKGSPPTELIKTLDLKQIDDKDELKEIVEQTIENNPDEVKKYKDGKKNVIGFFVGQIMKKTKGKANPQLVNSLLKQKLNTNN